MNYPEDLSLEAVELANRPEPRDDGELAAYLADLKKHEDAVLALGDGMDGETWFRTHSRLVTSGLWAKLKPCSRTVYIVLSAAADRRTRATYVGIAKVAGWTGLSERTVMTAYRELKDCGLICRRRVRVRQYQPYLTVLLQPKRWRMGATPQSAERLEAWKCRHRLP